MSSSFRIKNLVMWVLILGMFTHAGPDVFAESFKDGWTDYKKVGSKFKMRNHHADSGGGVANMCTGVLLGMAQTLEPGGETSAEHLQALYQQFLKEQQNIRSGKFGKKAESVGIIRGALIQGIAENPGAENELVTQADQCVADMFEPACNPFGFSCNIFNNNCCNRCIGGLLGPFGFCS